MRLLVRAVDWIAAAIERRVFGRPSVRVVAVCGLCATKIYEDEGRVFYRHLWYHADCAGYRRPVRRVQSAPR